MYHLFIKYRDNSETDRDLPENVLRDLLLKGTKKPIKWATVTTPSGTKRDVTKIMEK